MDRTTLMDPDYARILVSPRPTIRSIVDRDPRYRVVALAIISGFIGALAAAIQIRSPKAFKIGAHAIPAIASSTMWKIRIGQVISSPIVAIGFLYLKGAILRWSGGLLGGQARAVEVRAALGWSSVASLLTALVIIAFALIDPSATIAASDLRSATTVFARRWPHFVLSLALGLYAFIISLQCIAEVHQFSAWRALGAWAIESLVLIGTVIVLGMAVPLLAVFLFS
jgi:Yip1 domain